MINKPLCVAIIAMIASVTSANYLVQFPINSWITYGAFTYPATYLVSELVNRFYGSKMAKKVVYAGFIVAIVLSFAWFDKRIAIASCTAFIVSQLLDISIFTRFRQSIWWIGPVVASTTSSAIDTTIFFSIAFYGTAIPWIPLAIGDYFVKTLMNVVFLLPFRLFIRRKIQFALN